MLHYVWEYLWELLLGLNYALVIIFSVLIILKNSNPVKTLSYLFALATLPFLGLLVYYLFGQDYRKNKIFRKKYHTDDTRLREWRNTFKLRPSERQDFERLYGAGLFKIYRLMRENEKAVLTYDNDVEILVNGEQKFKRLREDLRKAKDHIHLEYFVVNDDELGNEILDIAGLMALFSCVVAAQIGAHLDISSEPDKGSTVLLTLPLP